MVRTGWRGKQEAGMFKGAINRQCDEKGETIDHNRRKDPTEGL